MRVEEMKQLLNAIRSLTPEHQVSAFREVFEASPHLSRSLRKEAHRTLKRWTHADGVFSSHVEFTQALQKHKPSVRSYSPTALEQYSACPYRFYLYAILRFRIQTATPSPFAMDPLVRGSLAHEVKFRFFTTLREKNALPVTHESMPQACLLVNKIFAEVCEELKEALSFMHPYCREETFLEIRYDLNRWVSLMLEEEEFIPTFFELSYGLEDQRSESDPASEEEPVLLKEGIYFRGSIDLVEESRAGVMRATDYKTGKKRAEDGVIIKGGRTLQPALYAMVLAEKFPHKNVVGARLYYCTHTGTYASVSVALTEEVRNSVRTLVNSIERSVETSFFPRAPDENECTYCNYQEFCMSTDRVIPKQKQMEPLQHLVNLRALP